MQYNCIQSNPIQSNHIQSNPIQSKCIHTRTHIHYNYYHTCTHILTIHYHVHTNHVSIQSNHIPHAHILYTYTTNLILLIIHIQSICTLYTAH